MPDAGTTRDHIEDLMGEIQRWRDKVTVLQQRIAELTAETERLARELARTYG
jgi:predicted  nucleic acid-binding Zn-ribbon protein